MIVTACVYTVFIPYILERESTFMPLSIRNSEAEKLARRLSRLTGETMTEAISKSLRERLERIERNRSQDDVRKRIDKILARIDALPDLDTRTPDEILGYDENGLPS
jgi:antitoxin VapB